MSGHIETILHEAFAKSPRILLLGQSYLGVSQANPATAAFEAALAASEPYDHWLEMGGLVEDRAQQYLAIDRTIQAPAEVGELLRAEWTCVFTSSTDGTLRRGLEIPDQRLVVQITSPSFDRIDRSALTLLRLFGTIERPHPLDLPPADQSALRRRRSDASAMLARLPELLTPSGVLLVEGWLPSQDWLRPRDLASALASFLPGQVLLFGLSEPEKSALLADEDFQSLLDQGTVSVAQETLASSLASLIHAGLISPSAAPSAPECVALQVLRPRRGELIASPAPADHLSTIEVPYLEWRRLQQYFTILRDLDPTEPLPSSKEEQYRIFRSFLAGGYSTPPWSLLGHLAFRRHALSSLHKEVLRLCGLDTPQDHVVVLHGPSGSGKTILLQLLALELRRSGLPVVYLGTGLNFADYQGILDSFAALLESSLQAVDQSSTNHRTGIPPIAVVFDALEKDEIYVGLARYLSSRGKKALVVGSSFTWNLKKRGTQPHNARTANDITVHAIPLPPEIDDDEKEGLLAHIEGYVPQAHADLAYLLNLPRLTDSYFFAVLYRSLADARRPIEKGILHELTAGAEDVQRQVEATREEKYEGMILMEQKLREALRDRLDLLIGTKTSRASSGETYELKEALLLINAVMLVSTVGLKLPVSLALRLIRNNFRAYKRGFPEEIIVEHEAANGILQLSARHPLEAEVWVRHRIPLQADKIKLLENLALQIRPSEVGEDDCVELDFVVKLLQAFGPQGRLESARLYQSYDLLAGIVAELRQRFSHIHPRLLLVGSNAVREWVRVRQAQLAAIPEGLGTLAEIARKLTEAEAGLEEAIRIVRAGAELPLRGAPRRMLATLETELACILGTQLGSIYRLLSPQERALPHQQEQLDRYFRSARAAWLRALHFWEENFHALDTACWVSDDRIKAGVPNEAHRLDILADWNEVIERYLDLSIPPSQMEWRDEREADLSIALGDAGRFRQILERLGKRRPAAAFALMARFVREDEGDSAACTYLEETCGELLLRERSLVVPYMRYWWLAQTRFASFFPEDRIALAFDSQRWERLREIAEARLRCEGEEENGTTLFLLGCALIHLGHTVQAIQVFRHLEVLDIGGSRRARALLVLSSPQGVMRKLSGEYRGRRRGSNYLAWCDELGIEIPFNPAEFQFVDAREGRVLGPFYVALNYRGPYALPLHRAPQS